MSEPIHVRCTDTGTWTVHPGDADAALSSHASESDAERAAQEHAARFGERVVIHDRYRRLHESPRVAVCVRRRWYSGETTQAEPRNPRMTAAPRERSFRVPPHEEASMSGTTLQPFKENYLSPSLEHATTADAMHQGIITCPPDATLTTVARLMATNHVHAICVMGITPAQPSGPVVWGIVSDLDVVRAGAAGGADPIAADLAKTDVLTVRADRPLRSAAMLMAQHGLHHLVVVSTPIGDPVGILSTLDVAGAIAWGRAGS